MCRHTKFGAVFLQKKLEREIKRSISRKVCIVLNNAPDYREGLLRNLSDKYELTVIAENNTLIGLSDPSKRRGYRFIEYFPFIFSGFRLAPLRLLSNFIGMDVVILSYNPRNLVFLIFSVVLKRFLKYKLIWWGQVYGRNRSKILEKLMLGLLSKGDSILVYTEDIKARLSTKIVVPIVSFNNSHVLEDDIEFLKNTLGSTLNLLFVGRYQQRKRLDRLIAVAKSNSFVRIRVVGPSMDGFSKILLDEGIDNIEVFGKTNHDSLKEHMMWANACINPGHAGLFVMTSAQFSRPLIVDTTSEHAPEIILAFQAKQYFVDFTNKEAVNTLLTKIMSGELNIEHAGYRLARILKESYTLEHMTEKHIQVLNTI